MPLIRQGGWILAVALLGWLLYLLHPVLAPFLAGILLAYMGDPLVDRLEARRIPRTWAVVLVFALFGLLVLAALLVLIPMLGRQLVRLYELAPQMLDWLQLMALPWLQQQLGLAEDFWRFEQLKATFAGQLDGAGDILARVLGQATASSLALLAWLGNLLLIPVVAFYLMRDWDLLMARLRALLPRSREASAVRLAGECHEVLGAFLRGQLLVMLALAVIYSTGLMLLGLELGLLIGVLAGLASVVPYMGFIVGLSAALAAALFQFGLAPLPLLGIGVVFMVGQLLEGMLLTPVLVGDRIGLHPVAVIFAILAGGQLFGFTGILLALPVAAVIVVLLRHLHELYKLSDLYREPAVVVSDDPPGPA